MVLTFERSCVIKESAGLLLTDDDSHERTPLLFSVAAAVADEEDKHVSNEILNTTSLSGLRDLWAQIICQ